MTRPDGPPGRAGLDEALLGLLNPHGSFVTSDT